MGIRLVYQPPAALIAGAAETAGAGKKQYRDQEFAERQKQFKAQMDLNWEQVDLARDQFAFQREDAAAQRQAGVEAQDKAIAAAAQQAQAIDARVRELAAMGINADKAAALAREEAATKRQKAAFTQAGQTADQGFLDSMPQQIQRFDAMLADAAKNGRVLTPEQQDRIDQLKRDYAMLGQMNDLTPAQKATVARSIMGELQGVSPVGKAPPTIGEQIKTDVAPWEDEQGNVLGGVVRTKEGELKLTPLDPHKHPDNVAKEMEQQRKNKEEDARYKRDKMQSDSIDKATDAAMKAFLDAGNYPTDGETTKPIRSLDEIVTDQMEARAVVERVHKRAEALALIEQAAKEHGVPLATLHQWIVDAGRGDQAKAAILKKYGIPF